ncbi:TetR/AcrR family transcriptional regulator [Pedobacter frigiditerrae]|nr:TetR/AcrR family transcriptional regulator [Pedobacter frigiditerrae]
MNVKHRILDAASRLFYTQGYNLTGINQIIEEAGIAKASLYSHFPSKSNLLLAYLNQQSRNFFSDLEKFIKDSNGGRKKILAIFEYHIYAYESSGFIGCPFLKIKAEVKCDETAVLNVVKENKDRLRRLIREQVVLLKEQQDLSNENLTDTLYFLLEGSTVTATITKSTAEMKSALGIVKSMI